MKSRFCLREGLVCCLLVVNDNKEIFVINEEFVLDWCVVEFYVYKNGWYVCSIVLEDLVEFSEFEEVNGLKSLNEEDFKEFKV